MTDQNSTPPINHGLDVKVKPVIDPDQPVDKQAPGAVQKTTLPEMLVKQKEKAANDEILKIEQELQKMSPSAPKNK